MVAQERLTAALSSVFGALAVVLAAIGLYGVVAYGTSRRTSEFGIRMALGAQRGDVQRLVLRQTIPLIVAGVAGGVAGAVTLAHVLSRRDFGHALRSKAGGPRGLRRIDSAAGCRRVARGVPARQARLPRGSDDRLAVRVTSFEVSGELCIGSNNCSCGNGFAAISRKKFASTLERIEELVAGGVSTEDTAGTARREFGNTTLLEEHSREVWQCSWFETSWRTSATAGACCVRIPFLLLLPF